MASDAQEKRQHMRSRSTGRFRPTAKCEWCGRPSAVNPTVLVDYLTLDLCARCSANIPPERKL